MESRPKKLLDQALSALLFLYHYVLSQELGLVDSVRAKPSQHVPTVLSRAEVQAVLHEMSGMHDRYTLLPASLPEPLQDHLIQVKRTHSLVIGG